MHTNEHGGSLMSWGQITVTSVAVADVAAAIDTATATYKASLAASDYVLDQAATDAITAASVAAKAIVDSGVAGDGLVNVTMNGHANPDHKPVKGWANDFVTITVSCADPQPTS
jgi:hypothetical protein